MSFIEAQRFPGEFDGINAGASAYNRTPIAVMFTRGRHASAS
jgi:hypothetical protein